MAPTWSQLGPTRPQVGASKCPLAAPSWLKSPPESPQRAQKLARRPPRSPKLPRGPYFARFWTLWDPILRASGCFLMLLGALDLEADLWQKTQQTHLQGPPPAHVFSSFFKGTARSWRQPLRIRIRHRASEARLRYWVRALASASASKIRATRHQKPHTRHECFISKRNLEFHLPFRSEISNFKGPDGSTLQFT